MRLQKYLATAGIASRRVCEQYILEGRVEVNGETVTELGRKVENNDKVVFDNKLVQLNNNYVYYLLNKPTGYVTTVKDEKQRPTVMDLIKDTKNRVFPVGRLDYNTSGLLILTNDGQLTYELTHPKHNINKIYQVKVKGKVTQKELVRLSEGVFIDGRKTAPAKVERIKENQASTVLSITIHEGRNRQIRKMCEAVNHEVLTLKRIAIGKIKLEDLKPGEYRHLTQEEIEYLKNTSGNFSEC